MDRRLFVVGMASALIVPAAFADEPATSKLAWHKKTQRSRNSSIVSAAKKDLNSKSGLSCKDWVRKVVASASDNHVNLPSHETNRMWRSNQPESKHVVGRSAPINKVEKGEIIQMELKSGVPHTAIVTARSSKSVTLIESNRDSTPDVDSDAMVTSRTITFDAFYAELSSKGAYSVYYVL